MRRLFLLVLVVLAGLFVVNVIVSPPASWLWLLLAPIVFVGLYDYFQTEHAFAERHAS